MISFIERIKDRIQGKAPTGAKRHPHWRRLRKSLIKRQPFCSICDRRKGLEAHHIVSFWIAPDLEMDVENLVILCRRCHLVFGHCGSWSEINPTCLEDVIYWRQKFQKEAL